MQAPRQSIPLPARRGAVLTAGAVLVFAGLVAYHASFSSPFVFDDQPSIVDNPTLRRLWPLWSVFFPPRGSALTVAGRPVVNFTLAVNHAISGTGVWSYHVFNLAMHLAAGLALFGIVRRTLLAPAGRRLLGAEAGNGTAALLVGWTAALLWTLHPLQTEAVTYVVQRTESLMGCFYLLTLYCFVRGAGITTGVTGKADSGWRSIFRHGVHGDRTESTEEFPSPQRDRGAQKHIPSALWGENAWFILSVISCLLGMGCKEVMVSAPVIVLLYDRTFAAGSFGGAWRRRRGYYLGLAATWVPLALLVASTGGNRDGTAGFDVGVPWHAYWLTQCEAVARYLGLALWPHPLVFEYGTFWVSRVAEIVPGALLAAALVGATAIALRRWPAAGFLGAWFLAILAPTSLVPGTIQMIVEHRMYLPLAALAALEAVALFRCVGRAGLPAALAAAAALGWLTDLRNHDYASARTLWQDTIAKRPANPRAHLNLGKTLAAEGSDAAALACYEKAVALRPGFAEARIMLGNALLSGGRAAEAADQYREALRSEPDNPNAHINLGNVLSRLGRPAEAVGHYEAALRVQPGAFDAHFNLGNALFLMRRWDEGIAHYRAGLRLAPGTAEAHLQLAMVLCLRADWTGAEEQLRETLRLQPDLFDGRLALGNVLATTGRLGDAAAEFREALRLRPGDPTAQRNLDRAEAALRAPQSRR